MKKVLLNQYEINKYPNKETITKLASELSTTTRSIFLWFINRRHKLHHTKSYNTNCTNSVVMTAKENKKKKRDRIYFDSEMKSILLKEYEKNEHPSKHTINELAFELNITEKKVRIWFHNRRQKLYHQIKRYKA
jgi:hypothetical protein